MTSFVYVLSIPDYTQVGGALDSSVRDSPPDKKQTNFTIPRRLTEAEASPSPNSPPTNTRIIVTRPFPSIDEALTYKSTPPCSALFDPPTTYVLYSIEP